MQSFYNNFKSLETKQYIRSMFENTKKVSDVILITIKKIFAASEKKVNDIMC